MLTTPFRRCNQFLHINGVVTIGNSNIGQIVSSFGNARSYAKDKGCCPDTPQTEGKKIEPWPKSDPPPPPMWRCECPKDPQPPNYDPYRIKVPDVVVPPIPASNAKWMGVVLTVDQQGRQESSPVVGQQPAATKSPDAPGAQDQASPEAAEEEEPQSEGFFASLKSYFGFGKSKKGDGEMSMIGKSEVPTEDGREPIKNPEINLAANANLQDLFHDSPIVHPDYWKDKTKRGLPPAAEGNVFPRLGYHGRSKYKYAFHEPWKPLDRVTLMAQAEKEEEEMAGAIEAAEKIDKQTT